MIEISHVDKHYGAMQVLTDVSMRFADGEVTAILGPSGAGKSTLIRCINCLEAISGGDILVDGRSVRDRRAMVGTWLGRAFWGTGVNAASKALVLHLAFATLGLERVGAYTNTANVRSQRALEKVGFRREGELRRWHRHGDQQLDVYLYGVLREEWTPMPGVEVRGTPPAAWLTPGATPS